MKVLGEDSKVKKLELTEKNFQTLMDYHSVNIIRDGVVYCIEYDPEGDIPEVKIEVSWSDRCISCKFFKESENMCKEHSIKIVEFRRTTCPRWRYKF